jgi:hypothetical protein
MGAVAAADGVVEGGDGNAFRDRAEVQAVPRNAGLTSARRLRVEQRMHAFQRRG